MEGSVTDVSLVCYAARMSDLLAEIHRKDQRYRSIITELYREMPSDELIDSVWIMGEDVANTLHTALVVGDNLAQRGWMMYHPNLRTNICAKMFGMNIMQPSTIAPSYIALCNYKTGRLLESF